MNIKHAYRDVERNCRISESRIGCIVALILVPAGIILDYVVYPDYVFEFMLVRLLCVALILVLYLLHFTKVIYEHIKIISFLWLILVQFSIVYMVYATDGVYSSYYAGLNLALIAVGILLPTSTKEAVVFCISTIFLYIAAIWLNGNYADLSVFFNNMYFLVLTSVISVTSVYFNVNRRFTEFRLSFELDERNKRLSELDKLKSNFFANVSHELRTPLTLILGPVQDLMHRDQLDSKHVKAMLSLINNNALRLLKLVNDILDVVRLEEGKSYLKREVIDVNSCVKGIVNSFEHTAKNKRIDLSSELSGEALTIYVDKDALEKIIINILANAVKFTNEGGQIFLRTYLKDENAVIEVEDTGIGIKEDEIAFVFDRFRQADGSSTRKHQGTGLGLALVKELVDAQDGEVHVYSNLGEGTVMLVNFPMTKDVVTEVCEVANDSVVESKLAGLHEQSVAGSLSNVDDGLANGSVVANTNLPVLLIVEDERDIRLYLRNLLQNEYQVYLAEDGREAIELLEKHKPDLVVLDIMMPEIDGLEVCRRIKNNTALKTTKVLLLTARVDEAAKINALKLGADDFLTKPFSSIEVKTRLSNLYEASNLQRELSRRNADLERAISELKNTQACLVQSEKLNALGKMSAGLLHEINNPLNYSLMALQLAVNDPILKEDEGLLDTCNDAIEGMERISAIVTDLNAFVYPSEIKNQEPLLLSAILEKALRFTAKDLVGVQMELNDVEGVAVHAAEGHLTQVFINLLSNAASAINASERHDDGLIRISCERLGSRVFISVQDNGCGIDENALADIFNPFYTTKDVGEGMGIGLSICYTIIKSHGGELKATSEKGQGARFSFDLQIVDANDELLRA